MGCLLAPIFHGLFIIERLLTAMFMAPLWVLAAAGNAAASSGSDLPRPGATKEQVTRALGPADTWKRSTLKKGEREIWTYEAGMRTRHRVRIYFLNGVIEKVDEQSS